MNGLADQVAHKLFWFCLKICLRIIIASIVVWGLVVVTTGIGVIVGCYKYVRCTIERRSNLSSIRKDTEVTRDVIEGAFFRHHYQILYDVDCEVAGEHEESIVPGDDVRPRSGYGILRPLNLLSCLSWMTKLLYVSCARVGFAICFGISMMGVTIEVLLRRLRGLNKAKMEEQDA